MQYMSPSKTALTFAFLIGGFHVVWSLFVALGWAQALVNFSMWAHMISVPVVIKAFDISAATTVVIIAAIVGYILGYFMAVIWNRLHHV